MISNASPLIIFGKLNKLNLLKIVLKKIIIPPFVYKEVVEKGMVLNSPEAFLVKDFIDKKEIEIKELSSHWQKEADFFKKVYSQLDFGEAETIALALQESQKAVLIDERTARKVAGLHGLKPIGSLRVLLSAFRKNLIDESEIKDILSKMTATEFRLSGELINKFWSLFEKLKEKKK